MDVKEQIAWQIAVYHAFSVKHNLDFFSWLSRSYIPGFLLKRHEHQIEIAWQIAVYHVLSVKRNLDSSSWLSRSYIPVFFKPWTSNRR